jgi:hypothetical protein
VPCVNAASSVLAGFAPFWFKLAVSFVAFEVVVFERCLPFTGSKCEGLSRGNANEKRWSLLGNKVHQKEDLGSFEAAAPSRNFLLICFFIR